MIIFLEGGRGYIAACDTCGTHCPVRPTPNGRAARAAADAEGWVKRGRRRLRYCPDCRQPAEERA